MANADVDETVQEFVTAAKKAMMAPAGRSARGKITQEQLADASGVSQSVLSNLLGNGNKTPDRKRRDELAKDRRLVRIWRALDLQDGALFIRICDACGLNAAQELEDIPGEFEDIQQCIAENTAGLSDRFYCPDNSCIGAVLVPAGKSALVIPWETCGTGKMEKSCAWCGAVLLPCVCGNKECGATMSLGATCRVCGDRKVEPPLGLTNLEPDMLARKCDERNAQNERLRGYIRSSRRSPGGDASPQ